MNFMRLHRRTLRTLAGIRARISRNIAICVSAKSSECDGFEAVGFLAVAGMDFSVVWAIIVEEALVKFCDSMAVDTFLMDN